MTFLRARKYSMDKVFDSFEKALIFVRNHEDWFDWNGDRLQRANDLYNSGFLKVMKHRDSEGRRVIIGNNKLDMSRFNADDVFRLHCMIILSLALEEETQINGAIIIDDFTAGITMKYLTMFPLKSIYDFTLQLKVTPIRLKNIFIVGLPSFAAQFLNILKLGLSEVMHKRLQVLDNLSDLWSFVDQSIMTKDYNGTIDEDDAIEDFRKILEPKLDELRKFLEFDLDMSKAASLKNNHENIGSFRKLEID